MVKQRRKRHAVAHVRAGKVDFRRDQALVEREPFTATRVGVAQVVRDQAASIQLYPDMGAVAVRERIAEHCGVRAENVAVDAALLK